MFCLTPAGLNSFDVHTRRGAFAGLIGYSLSHKFYRVYFNSTATKGSTRKFPSVAAAVEYIRDRRVKKGWGI